MEQMKYDACVSVRSAAADQLKTAAMSMRLRCEFDIHEVSRDYLLVANAEIVSISNIRQPI